MVVKMIFEAELEYFFMDNFVYGICVLLLGIYILLMAKLYHIDMIVWIMMGMVSAAAAFVAIGFLIYTDETRE